MFVRIFVLISLLFCSCDFARGVKKDTQKRITLHKQFIQILAFNGQIQGKTFCSKCQSNNYQISILLKELNPKEVSFSNQSFQPYYFFATADQLTLSVTKDIYQSLEKGMMVEKQPNSNFLIVGNQKFKILNDEKYKWLP